MARQGLRPELHLAVRTVAQFRVLGLLLMTAALATADLQIAAHESGPTHRSTQDVAGHGIDVPEACPGSQSQEGQRCSSTLHHVVA